ncbi:MAG TPA: thiolase domain-containing protein [Actinomycetota bacterium]|nr:thiolase domain-containing protein [Actinomycetota bacterium]
MRDVAVISFAQSASVRREPNLNEVEMIVPVVTEAIENSGIARKDIGFTVSGSCDYLAGQPFAFVMGLDAIGAWPPIQESHVEMDGAWALYEAWVRLQHGDIDSALIYCFGKSSLGSLRDVLSLQLDPYYLAPLWPDSVSLAALQARAVLENTDYTERDMAEVAVRSRRDAQDNPNAHVTGDDDPDELLNEPYIAAPLRKHDCPPISDGAAAIVLAAGDLAREKCERPAWIKGIDHRIDAHQLGARDLTKAPSARIAGEAVGAVDNGFDVAEIHAPFTHQELILRDEFGLSDSTKLNPSGGALAANPMMVAGLIRIGEAASRVMDGSAGRALAHATSGPCLQQNLVCVLEGA